MGAPIEVANPPSLAPICIMSTYDDTKKVESIASPLDSEVLPSSPMPHTAFNEKHVARIKRKIDIHLLPLLAALYLMSYLDRGNSKCTK